MLSHFSELKILGYNDNGLTGFPHCHQVFAQSENVGAVGLLVSIVLPGRNKM
jgi:hypothetical protein